MRSLMPLVVSLAMMACATGNDQAGYVTPTQSTVAITTEDGGSSPTVRLTRDGYVAMDEIVGEPEELWRLLPQVYEGIGLPLPTVDSRARSAVIENHVINRRVGDERMSNLLECGNSIDGPNADTHRITMTLRTWVTPAEAEGRSIVRTQLQATARHQMHGSSGSTHCSSKGRLEMLIRERIRETSVQQRLERIRSSGDIQNAELEMAPSGA